MFKNMDGKKNATFNLKKNTTSGIFWKGLERIFAQLVSAIVTIILARILIPDDYSIVSVVTIFFTFCNILISGGFNSALVQKKEADITDYSTVLMINMIVATVLYLILFFFAPFIAELFDKELLTSVIRIMGVTFFINAFKSVLSAKITSDLQFKKFFWSTIIGTIVSGIIGIYMALKGYGVWALVVQQMVNSFVDTLVLTITSKFRFKFVISGERFKKLFKFGWKILLSSLINETYNQTKPLIVGLKYSTLDLAYYNKGKTYPNLFASTANDTLSFALFPVMSKIQDDKTQILSVTRRFMQISSFLVFPMMIGFLAISEPFVKVVLTDKWLPIVPYLMIFCVSDMLKPIQTGNLQAIKAIGRGDVYLILEIIKKILFFSVIIVFVFLTNNPTALALSGILTSVFASLINSFPNQKLLGYSYKMQVSDLLLNFITAGIMGVAVYFMNFIPINIIVLLFLQVLLGIVLYLGLNILLKNKSLIYLLTNLKIYLSRKNSLEKNNINDFNE